MSIARREGLLHPRRILSRRELGSYAVQSDPHEACFLDYFGGLPRDPGVCTWPARDGGGVLSLLPSPIGRHRQMAPVRQAQHPHRERAWVSRSTVKPPRIRGGPAFAETDILVVGRVGLEPTTQGL
jgi:hypothetical protein